jgi:hypothetical protein
MKGNKGYKRETERNDLGGRETITVERENGVGHLRSWCGLILTVDLNQHGFGNFLC